MQWTAVTSGAGALKELMHLDNLSRLEYALKKWLKAEIMIRGDYNPSPSAQDALFL